MDSQEKETFTDVIEKLSAWSAEETQGSIGNALPVLLSILKCPEEKALNLQAIQALLGKCLPCIPVDEVEEKVLQYTLPATHKLFLEALEGIQIRLQDIQEPPEEDFMMSLKGLLQVCIEIVNCLNCLIIHVSSLGKVEASLIPSVPEVTMNILQETFRHCKESEVIYGTLFQVLGEVLTAFFQRGCELQQRFLGLLTDNLYFNCVFEDELVLLTKTLEKLAKMGQIVSELDVKTMAEQWKGYARLAFQYAEHLKNRLDVASPIQFLTSDISSGLEKIVSLDSLDMKLVTRTVKIASFSLKIVIKFCDQYSGYLGPCHEELLLMLLSMYRYSRPYLEMKNVQNDVIQTVQTHVTIGAEPLLKYLINDPEFIEKYFSHGRKLSQSQSEHLDFIFLSTSILKKLIDCGPSERKLWMMKEPDNILFVLFRTVNHCHKEMSWDLHIPGIRHGDEQERMTDLYEHLLTHIGGFILTTSVHEFPIVEHAFLESVMQPDMWRALLAIDIWCLVARTGTSELCFQHLNHVIHVLKSMSEHRGRPEKTYLVFLARRLFSLLSNKHKGKMTELFSPSVDPYVWHVLGVKDLPERLQINISKSLLQNAQVCVSTALNKGPTVTTFHEMVDSLEPAVPCLENLGVKSQLRESEPLLDFPVHILMELWDRALPQEGITPEETSVKGAQAIQRFWSVLCSVTAAYVWQLNNTEIVKVLGKIKCLLGGPSSLRLKVVKVLHSLAHKTIKPTSNQKCVFKLIAELFAALLLDESALVEQMALETFKYFAHVNLQTEIIRMMVGQHPSLTVKTKQYLQGVPAMPSQSELLSAESYINQQAQIHFTHCCKQENQVSCNESDTATKPELTEQESDLSVVQPSKRLKLEDMRNSVSNIKEHISVLQEYCKDSILSPEEKEELQKLSKTLSELC